MKLIRCKNCNDVVRLIHTHWRTCDCGLSGGQYNADLMTATVGGLCEVFGISNLFFDDDFNKLSDEEKVEYRKSINHNWCEIWFGEQRGDNQIHRIESPSGPRLEMIVDQVGENLTLSTFTDSREYKLNLDGEQSPRSVVVSNAMKPSFLDESRRKIKTK